MSSPHTTAADISTVLARIQDCLVDIPAGECRIGSTPRSWRPSWRRPTSPV
ncbi:MAG TPA: hypothetical protein VI076_03490 [Actinopolymorphaceae bacterium]